MLKKQTGASEKGRAVLKKRTRVSAKRWLFFEKQAGAGGKRGMPVCPPLPPSLKFGITAEKGSSHEFLTWKTV
jgi:hypothetical protein